MITRFAPSPTGYIHIGNVRSAIYPYLLARQTGGKFILRIEDTDRARYVASATDLILDTLKWLGLDWDEGPEKGGPAAPYFQGADLLIAADCTAFAYGNFHNDFIRGRVTLIGCPKLDMVDYSQKLTQLFTNNEIRSIIVVRMTVPCCGGISYAVNTAIEASGKKIPVNVITISPDGQIVA